MDSTSCLRNQDVSDILAKDLAKRLIEKDHQDDTVRKAKKIRHSKDEQTRYSKDEQMQKRVDYSLVDLKYINKTPDEIIENTLQELSSLNDLLNHALDKTLGLNETTKPLNLTGSNQSSPSSSTTNGEPEFNDFKVPKLPSSRKASSSKDRSSKSSKSSSSNDRSSAVSPSSTKESSSKESVNENNLIQSIVNEVIHDNQTEEGEIEDDESKTKLRKKKKKKDEKHTHHCSKHRKRKQLAESEKQPAQSKEYETDDDHPFRDKYDYSTDHQIGSRGDYYGKKSYEEDKYYSSKRSHKKNYHETESSFIRYYSDDEYDERPRKYESNRYYNKSRSKYEMESRPYGDYKYDKYYDKYHDKTYARSYESRYEGNKSADDKDPFSTNKLRIENTISNWTKFCSKMSKEQQDDDNSSIESRDFYSDDDDTRSIISERILNRDALKAKEIRFEVRDFKSRQTRSANEIKQEIMEQFPISSGLTHQWKEVDKPPTVAEKTTTNDKKSKKSSSEAAKELEDKVDDFLNKHVQVNKFGFDIGSIMSQRLAALKILEKDATNQTALNQLKEADELINKWSLSKPTNSEEDADKASSSTNSITIDNVTYESYSDFTKAAKSKDGIGMALLCKMGWQPGTGLGNVISPL